MARMFEDRLARLQNRRYDPSLVKKGYFTEEAYNRRADKPATRYVLGAMQEVDRRSTEISIEEAARVENALNRRLNPQGIFPDFRLQGSVPANVHIRSASDVDMLCIERRYLTYVDIPDGRISYSEYTGLGTLTDDILALRSKAETALEIEFYAADVDCTPNKSIALSKGSFRRKVDLVPAGWYDTAQYQRTENEVYRGVDIVDKSIPERISNYPFRYIYELSTADEPTNGGMKMAIRLVKNIKNDAESEPALSSYDIGSLMYHCPPSWLTYFYSYDLSILNGTEKWFARLAQDQAYAQSLKTPDETRYIIDTSEKWEAIHQILHEIREIGKAVMFEDPNLIHLRGLLNDHERIRTYLDTHSIPLAA